MTDKVDQKTRSRIMAKVPSKDSTPEMMVRKRLHSEGFRYRVHCKDLPGTPDIVLPKFHVAIFVNGCFWHGHNCSHFRKPDTNRDYWSSKIERNRCRDIRNEKELRELGWRVYTIWECALEEGVCQLLGVLEKGLLDPLNE